MKLVGAITEGSGTHNEDAFGFLGTPEDVTAAWVFDGVTGINSKPLLHVPSEPAWFVSKANQHLHEIVEAHDDVFDILRDLVSRLAQDWSEVTSGLHVPEDYDLPAACLILAKRVANRWQVLRLGDSYVLSVQGGEITNHPHPPSDLSQLESELKQAARNMRAFGQTDLNALQDRFRPRLRANRKNRNTPGSYSILVPDASSLVMPEVFEIRSPEAVLLCSDGFYRAVDTYDLMDDSTLYLQANVLGGVENLLKAIRQIEASDPLCQSYLRFKPADDATAIMLASG